MATPGQTAELLEQLRPAILFACKKCASRRPNWIDWDDLVQQATLLVLELHAAYEQRPGSNFEPYVKTYLWRYLFRSVDHWRGRRKKVGEPIIERSVDPSELPERSTVDEDVTVWLVAQEAPGWPVVRAIAMEGHSVRTAAEALGLRRSVAWDRYRKGLMWLKTEFCDAQ